MHPEAKKWVEHLNLQPHPEGGFFKETYRGELNLPSAVLGNDFAGDRSISTGIYYLLCGSDFSALHRIASDEVWHFYAGTPLRVEGIHSDGRREDWILSNDGVSGMPQAIVPAGVWFGSRLVDSDGFALVGCTVAPGFDFNDFQMANRDVFVERFPEHSTWIESLTRKQ